MYYSRGPQSEGHMGKELNMRVFHAKWLSLSQNMHERKPVGIVPWILLLPWPANDGPL